LVNGRKSTIASRVLKAGDVVEVANRPGSREVVKNTMDAAESRGVSPWLTLDKANAKGEILHVPSREEIQPIVNEQLIVELYSK
jgi:small subunit ribosomal protein S4